MAPEQPGGIAPRDVVSVAGSHCAFQCSDVTVALTVLLPALPPRATIGLHDVFLPGDAFQLRTVAGAQR